MTNTAPFKNYYDLDQLKAISILDVCRTFGIEVQQRSGVYRCKLRPERTASVVLHPPEASKYPNSFHDFGSNQHGDVIDLVATVQRIDRKEAIRVLAEAFGIPPIDPRKGLSPDDLTYREYSQIGLHGDRATKNFSFEPTRQSMERIIELSEKYAMPMNALRKQHPKIYVQILRDKAIPYVRNLRNEYYIDVYSKYTFFKNIGAEDLFYNENTKAWFDKEHGDKLRLAERILNRACKGTSIRAREPGEYDPIKDLQKLQRGELKPTIGPADYTTMKRAAEEQGTSVKYQTFDFSAFFSAAEELESFTYSAFLSEGKVVFGYLETDREALRPIIDAIRARSNPTLDKKIENAKEQGDAVKAPAGGPAPGQTAPTNDREER